MADRINDGGPAFPTEWHNDTGVTVSAPDGQIVPPHNAVMLYGLTMLDYFAAKALVGIMVAPGFPVSPEDAGLIAYRYAHGAMKARAAQ